MFTLLVWGINMCAPVHAQNKLDSLHQLSSHNVADALRYFSGIQIKDYGGVGGTENGEYPEYGNQPCRCVLRRHRAGKRTKRYGRSGKILARQHGVCHAVQRAKECHLPAGKGFRLVGFHLFTDTDASVRRRKEV